MQKPQGQTGDINHNSPEGTMSYKLSSVIVHLGDEYSGHFICYRRSPQTVQGTRHNPRWLCCSDTSVTTCSLNDVLSSEAYMLLYERAWSSPSGVSVMLSAFCVHINVYFIYVNFSILCDNGSNLIFTKSVVLWNWTIYL